MLDDQISDEQVGSGSPAQRENPFRPAPNFDASAAGGRNSAATAAVGGKADGSLVRSPVSGSSSSRGSSRRRRPSGNQVEIFFPPVNFNQKSIIDFHHETKSVSMGFLLGAAKVLIDPNL